MPKTPLCSNPLHLTPGLPSGTARAFPAETSPRDPQTRIRLALLRRTGPSASESDGCGTRMGSARECVGCARRRPLRGMWANGDVAIPGEFWPFSASLGHCWPIWANVGRFGVMLSKTMAPTWPRTGPNVAKMAKHGYIPVDYIPVCGPSSTTRSSKIVRTSSKNKVMLAIKTDSGKSTDDSQNVQNDTNMRKL